MEVINNIISMNIMNNICLILRVITKYYFIKVRWFCCNKMQLFSTNIEPFKTKHNDRRLNENYCCFHRLHTTMDTALRKQCSLCIIRLLKRGAPLNWHIVYCIYTTGQLNDIIYLKTIGADYFLYKSPINWIIPAEYNSERFRWLLDLGYAKRDKLHMDYKSSQVVWAYKQGFIDDSATNLCEHFCRALIKQCIDQILEKDAKNNAAIVIQRAWIQVALNPYTRLGRRILLRRALLMCSPEKWWLNPINTVKRLWLYLELIFNETERNLDKKHKKLISTLSIKINYRPLVL